MNKNLTGGLVITYGSTLPNNPYDGTLFYKSTGNDAGLYVFSFNQDANLSAIGDQVVQGWNTLFSIGTYLNKAGDVMTGPLYISTINSGTTYGSGETSITLNNTVSSPGARSGGISWTYGSSTNISAQIDTLIGTSNSKGTIVLSTRGGTGTLAERLRVDESGLYTGSNVYWHAGNDGTGSGLDADLLDGLDSTYFRNATNINTGTLAEARLPFQPVQQGGGTGQGTNKIYIGWNNTQLCLQIDSTNYSTTWPINIAGNATTASSAVAATDATRAVNARALFQNGNPAAANMTFNNAVGGNISSPPTYVWGTNDVQNISLWTPGSFAVHPNNLFKVFTQGGATPGPLTFTGNGVGVFEGFDAYLNTDLPSYSSGYWTGLTIGYASRMGQIAMCWNAEEGKPSGLAFRVNDDTGTPSAWGQWSTIYNEMNLTNISQLTNNVGYITNSVTGNLNVNGYISPYDTSRTYPAGISTELNSQLINFGINDDPGNRFGTYVQAAQGGWIKFDARVGQTLFTIYGRSAGSTTVAPVFTINSAGAANFASSISSSGNLLPGATNTYNIGSTSLRWANVISTIFSATNGASTGGIVLQAGNGANTGYVEFWSPQGNSQGFIGFSTSNATNQLGTITYYAANHAFNGGISVGTVTTTGNIAAPNYSIGSSTTSSAGSFGILNGNGPSIAMYGSAVGNQMIFYRGSSIESMRIDASGYIGIGIGSPQTKLHIYGTSEGVRLQFDNSYISFYNTAGTRRGYLQFGEVATVLNSESAIPLQFFTNSTERMRIDASGHMLPALVNTYNIGAFVTRWGTIYSNTFNAGAGSGAGYAQLLGGNGSNSGYLEFWSPGGNRQGYIGYSGTNNATDTGIIQYIAGQHTFTGTINASAITLTGAISASTFAGGSVNLGNSGALLINSEISRFESSEQTIPGTSSFTINVGHGGSRKPDIINAILRCKIAEHGWSVGDEVQAITINGVGNTASFGTASSAGIRYVTGVGAIAVPHFTSATVNSVTPANWKVVIYCHWL